MALSLQPEGAAEDAAAAATPAPAARKGLSLEEREERDICAVLEECLAYAAAAESEVDAAPPVTADDASYPVVSTPQASAFAAAPPTEGACPESSGALLTGTSVHLHPSAPCAPGHCAQSAR